MYPVPTRPQYVGSSEVIIGNWLTARGCRDDFVIATKVCVYPSSSSSIHLLPVQVGLGLGTIRVMECSHSPVLT